MALTPSHLGNTGPENNLGEIGRINPMARELQQATREVMGVLIDLDAANAREELEPFHGLWLSEKGGENPAKNLGAVSLGERRPTASVSIYAAGEGRVLEPRLDKCPDLSINGDVGYNPPVKEQVTRWSWAIELTEPDRRQEISRTFISNGADFIGIFTKYTDPDKAPTVEYYPQNPDKAIGELKTSLRKFFESPDGEEDVDLFSYIKPNRKSMDSFSERDISVGPDFKLDYPKDSLRAEERMQAMRETTSLEQRPVLELVSPGLPAA